MIISRTPFRVSFVGGGSDLPAFCDKRPGAVLSVSIDKAMYVTLHPYFDRKKTLLRYSRTEVVESLDDIEHPIFREALRMYDAAGGLEISSTADVPSGTGLGSSSSFTVGLLHVLAAHKGRYVTREELGRLASHLEIDLLGEPIGRQDQYAAAFGGLNVIEFHGGGEVRVEPLALPRPLVRSLDSRLLMFYTGHQRATRTILSDQSASISKNVNKFDATCSMVELVYEMREALHAGDLDAFGALLHRNWLLKKTLSSRISSPEIDQAYQAALTAGAKGGKLCGAGGGGFLLLYCEESHQPALRQALSHLHEMPFRFSHTGSQIIFTDGQGIGDPDGFLDRH